MDPRVSAVPPPMLEPITPYRLMQRPILLGSRDQPHQLGRGRVAGPWFEHHRGALVRQEPEQRLYRKAVCHKHERPRSAPRGDEFLQLVEPSRGTWLYRDEGP